MKDSRYTQYKEDGVTVGVCHTGELTGQDKKAIERFKQEAIKRTARKGIKELRV